MLKFRILDRWPFPAVGTKCAPKSGPTDNAPVPQKYRLDYLSVFSGTNDIPTATVKVAIDRQPMKAVSDGASGIDAVFNAIGKILNPAPVIVFWSCPTIFRNRNDAVEFQLRLSANGKAAMGYCSSAVDMYEAAARAYIAGLNQLAAMEVKPGELEDNDPPEDESLASDEPVDSGPAPTLSLESQRWDEWEEQCFSEWHPRG